MPPILQSVLITTIGAAVAWAGSQGGSTIGGVPLFGVCASVAFVLNWLVFIPSYLGQSERYFDLTGSATYLAVLGMALCLGPSPPSRSLLLAFLVAIWALRLGSFLFLRIRRDGRDGRFDKLKTSAARFFTTWTLQGLWVLLTVSCALAAITAPSAAPLGAASFVGTALWVIGFVVEVTADRQKTKFRSDPGNRGRFITTGLWARSRHPNYFGEILLWSGIALIAAPTLSGWRWVTMVSPLFVYLLLTRVSGIPLLERRAQRRWGNDPNFQRYTATTPELVPSLRHSSH